MPFGRHRGLQIRDLPDAYILWLTSLADLREPLRGVIFREARRRGFAEEEPRDTEPPGERWTADGQPRGAPARTVVEELIGAGLRGLARRYHPDAGGAHEQMIAVTSAADWLREQSRNLR